MFITPLDLWALITKVLKEFSAPLHPQVHSITGPISCTIIDLLGIFLVLDNGRLTFQISWRMLQNWKWAGKLISTPQLRPSESVYFLKDSA